MTGFLPEPTLALMDATKNETDEPRYEAPTVVDYGSLAEITAGTLSGDFLDKTFPVNTPRGDLTFS